MFEAEPTLYLGTLLYFVLIMLTVSLIIFTMFTAVLTNFFLQQVKEGDEDDTRLTHGSLRSISHAEDQHQRRHSKRTETAAAITNAWASIRRSSNDAMDDAMAYVDRTTGRAPGNTDTHPAPVDSTKPLRDEENAVEAHQVHELGARLTRAGAKRRLSETSSQHDESRDWDYSKILRSKPWLLSMDCLILTNTFCLCIVGSIPKTWSADNPNAGLEQIYGEALRKTLLPILDACSVLFICEIIFRMFVAGALWKFFQVQSNTFDCVVTIVSSLGIVIQQFGASANAVDAMRALAVIRILRIMMVFRGTRLLMISTAESIPRILGAGCMTAAHTDQCFQKSTDTEPAHAHQT